MEYLEAYSTLYKYLVDEGLSFDQNRRRILEARGFKPSVDWRVLDLRQFYDENVSTDCIKPSFERIQLGYEERYKVGDILKISSYQELLYLFDHKSVRNYTVVPKTGEAIIWSRYALRHCEDISPDKLEGFVARFVRVLNHIGCYTNYSCDGWHHQPAKRCLFVGFTDRYSKAWFKTIIHSVFQTNVRFREGHPRMTNENIMSIVLPLDDERRVRAYLKLNNLATELEENEEKVQRLRDRVIFKISNQQKAMDELSIMEIENLFIQAVSGSLN